MSELVRRYRVLDYFGKDMHLSDFGTTVEPRKISFLDCAVHDQNIERFAGGVALCLYWQDPDGYTSREVQLWFDQNEWSAFVDGSKNGEFDFIAQMVPPDGYIPLADSKDYSQAEILFGVEEWGKFLEQIKDGLFDDPPAGCSDGVYVELRPGRLAAHLTVSPGTGIRAGMYGIVIA